MIFDHMQLIHLHCYLTNDDTIPYLCSDFQHLLEVI